MGRSEPVVGEVGRSIGGVTEALMLGYFFINTVVHEIGQDPS